MMDFTPAAAIAARRSREGAWIEMRTVPAVDMIKHVAPVRERGLKS